MCTLQGKTQPTRHTLSTLSLHMVYDHTYLTQSTDSNLPYGCQQIWTDPLHPRRRAPDTIRSTLGLTDPWVRTQLLSHNSPWSSGKKSSFCWHLTTRLTGPISLACDRYVQYLLAGANPSVLNRHRRGLPSWRCWFTIYHSPTFPTSCLHFPPEGSARSPI
jgi:hypothetical protein